ncbi:TetR/AcrR family transcriptional regulator [Iamia sp. SCSIO 61187]|uniref:TetR/AcrR family transcriptional regulator n=1 Tax=Iamia sp. SCSIO 61187 TaxID=2722752 RepID=UPI001C62B392|nr:TetR/AcrR family transcriptional regulator [Iamia sp. SCSIO 61187]QYG92225.1 TetR/AcrR family transcriptional regulator [Iamia sp. SCSIO 61187]
MTAPATAPDTRTAIIEAARARLWTEGHAGVSTRKVAAAAGVPLSQLHYHFGSKQGLLLAVLEAENQRLLDRQQRMYSSDRPLWQRYEQACDFLDEDLESGYVRVLQEMIAEGWTNEAVGASVRQVLMGWYTLLTSVAEEAEARFGSLGPFTAAEVAVLIGNAFLGSEALILLGFERDELPVRAALRRLGVLIRDMEQESGDGDASAHP